MLKHERLGVCIEAGTARSPRLRAGVCGLALAAVAGLALVVAMPAGGAFAQGAEPAQSADQAAPPKKGKKAAAKAQQGPAKPSAAAEGDGGTKDPSAALAAYTAGVKAFQAGNHGAAITSLSNAIASGALAGNLMPKALYYRGASYQHTGKSGQAVSDLNSALYFKSGLDDAERAEANRLKAAAYHDAGMAVPAQASVQSAQVAPAETGSVNSAASSGSGSSGGLGGLFGNLFGGKSSSSSQTTNAAPATPAPSKLSAAAPVEAPQAPAAAVTAGEPEVLPWQKGGASAGGGEAAAAAAAAPAAHAPAKAAKAAAGKAKAGKAGGHFHVQVASVRSRDEASAVVTKLQGLGEPVASKAASVDEATFGSMGTFYRVRLGPYATAADAKVPCAALKAGGLDCLVTAN